MVKKIIFDIPSGETIEEEMSEAELQQREADKVRLEAEYQENLKAREEQATLKASAKAKLIAGEALTEDEANTIVL